MSEPRRTPVVILGGRGYVAGELLRLLAGHPMFEVAAVTSTSRRGDFVATAFPHLSGVLASGLRFVDRAGLAEALLPWGARLEAPVGAVTTGAPGAIGANTGTGPAAGSSEAPARPLPVGVFAATPHGETAGLLEETLRELEALGFAPRAVDLSADFRFADPARFASVYGREHRAPRLTSEFACAVPEHHAGSTPRHAAQPGCFTTATVLAAYPCFAHHLVEGPIFVSAVTGSSGSGRTPSTTTHHPERRSTMVAYAPLAHRHEAEMRMLLGAAAEGSEPEVEFVPHSGPFVRGIHATVRIPLRGEVPQREVLELLSDFYRSAPFVEVCDAPPRLNDVVGTNHCRLGVTVRGRTAVITSVIDNLVKGAAGGGVQWMNRLFGLPDETGLRLPGLGVY